MKAQMALEEVFKIVIFVVVALIVIGLVINFRDQIVQGLKLCDWSPSSCAKQEECSTNQADEINIDDSVLNRYCDSCWSKSGKVDLDQDCLCYIVKGTFTPLITNLPSYCQLTCNKNTTSILVYYDSVLKIVSIGC